MTHPITAAIICSAVKPNGRRSCSFPDIQNAASSSRAYAAIRQMRRPSREDCLDSEKIPTMIIRSYLVILWALFVTCGPAVAQSIAVFDFELIDTSLEGAIRGARPDEQERLARVSGQLRQLLRDS